MLDDFLTRAVLGMVLLAFASAPLGCFVIWRRMAFFGDTIAHSAILGVGAALFFSVSIFWGILMSAVLTVFILSSLSRRGGEGFDMHLGVISHSGLALGLIMASLVSNPQIDLFAYLFGDILAISKTGLLIVLLGDAVVLGVIIWRWRRLLTATLSADLARASGVNPHREELILLLLIAIIVAVATKIVGAFLIIATIIIPAATAHHFARPPFISVLLAFFISIFSALSGLALSFALDIPAGPAIVGMGGALFLLAQLYRA